MKIIDVPENILISAYWPAKGGDDISVGYGVQKTFIAFQLGMTLFRLISQLTNWFLEPRARTLMGPTTRLLAFLLPGVILALLSNRGRKYTGFYQLNNEGRPVQYLSPAPPESIKGRMGVGRKRFFEKVR